jgi:hypothetical protein
MPTLQKGFESLSVADVEGRQEDRIAWKQYTAQIIEAVMVIMTIVAVRRCR